MLNNYHITKEHKGKTASTFYSYTVSFAEITVYKFC